MANKQERTELAQISLVDLVISVFYTNGISKQLLNILAYNLCNDTAIREAQTNVSEGLFLLTLPPRGLMSLRCAYPRMALR